MMVRMQWLYIWTIIIFGTIVTCCASQYGAGQTEKEDFYSSPLIENFSIPLKNHIFIDLQAQRKVEMFIHEYLQSRERIKADMAHYFTQVDPDSFEVDISLTKELEARENAKNKQLRTILSLCKETEGTDAGVTSVLLLAVFAAKERPKAQNPNLIPITNALETIRQVFPDSWQGKVVPLVQAMLRKHEISQTGQCNAVSLPAVIEWLHRNMPLHDEVIDFDQPDIKAFSSIYPLQNPIRVNYLKNIAYTQFSLGTYSGLDKATETCLEIIQLYPGGEHAAWARRLISQIVALRQSMR